VLYYMCSFTGGIYLLLIELVNSTDITFPIYFVCVCVSFTKKYFEQKL
jgi:hypothetical protein